MEAGTILSQLQRFTKAREKGRRIKVCLFGSRHQSEPCLLVHPTLVLLLSLQDFFFKEKKQDGTVQPCNSIAVGTHNRKWNLQMVLVPPESQPSAPLPDRELCLSIVHRTDCGRQKERKKRAWWRNSGTCQKLGTFPSTTEQWTLFKWGYDLNHILKPLYCRWANEREKGRSEDRTQRVGWGR